MFLAQQNTRSITVLPGQVCPGPARMACPTEGIWLAQNRTRDSLFLQISFSNLSSISPINSKKEKSKKQNTEAWEWSVPPVSKPLLSAKRRCVYVHDTNPNRWMNWDSAHLQDPLPEQRGDPSALCRDSRVPTPPVRQPGWCKMPPGDAGKQLPEADHGWATTPTRQAGCIHTSRSAELPVSPQLTQSLGSAGSREASGPCPGL